MLYTSICTPHFVLGNSAINHPFQVSTEPLLLNYLVRYWQSYNNHPEHCELAKLAIRIFKTIANSVASERAFSAIGLIVTRLRNRLGAEKADKLIYIYLNQRVLDRHGDLLLGDWVDKTDKEQVELEELLLEFEAEDQNQGADTDTDLDVDDDVELDIERQLLE
jgi:hypothetical protein